MAKKAYIGVNNIARKIKKGYIGVGNTARKIKKAYIGIGGVARPCWSGGELAYYGTITPLSTPVYSLAADTFAEHALFAGGEIDGNNLSSVVNSYDKSLTKSTVTSLLSARMRMTATHNRNYVLFAYGILLNGGQVQSSRIDYYDSSFTHYSNTYSLSGEGCVSSHVGEYAITIGPVNGWGCYAFNGSMTETNLGSNVGFGNGASANFKNRAVFTGGYYSTESIYYGHVISFDESLTKYTHPDLSNTRKLHGAAVVGDYLLVGGGSTNTGVTNSVEGYDSSFTRTVSPNALSVGRQGPTANSLGDYALFAGGYVASGNYAVAVDAYDKSLTHTVQNLTNGRQNHAAATIEEYLIIAGGSANPSNPFSSAEVFTVA